MKCRVGDLALITSNSANVGTLVEVLAWQGTIPQCAGVDYWIVVILNRAAGSFSGKVFEAGSKGYVRDSSLTPLPADPTETLTETENETDNATTS